MYTVEHVTNKYQEKMETDVINAKIKLSILDKQEEIWMKEMMKYYDSISN